MEAADGVLLTRVGYSSLYGCVGGAPLVVILAASFEPLECYAARQVRGGLSNNFAQSADKQASQKTDISELAANYPHADIEVVGLEHWVDQDKQGNDGRYINQV